MEGETGRRGDGRRRGARAAISGGESVVERREREMHVRGGEGDEQGATGALTSGSHEGRQRRLGACRLGFGEGAHQRRVGQVCRAAMGLGGEGGWAAGRPTRGL
jgi:hypothetical protein